MYLKTLTLRGFKTFADKTTVEFNPSGGIIAVVGPNGCGKSNILDSIRWVLGEQSLKEVRSSSMEDIIFAGTSGRKPLSLAEATLVIDNSDKLLHSDYTEISIKRRVFRSGESEFYMNKNPCRLKDIRDLFMDTGLGKGSYSIINQGRVDAILSSKPDERREPFEEAAQISKYRFRKEAAGRKLIATEQNLLRINDIKQELSSRLVILEEQAGKARLFKDVKEKLRGLEVGLCKKALQSLDERKVSQQAKIEKLKAELLEAQNLFGKIEEDRQAFREELKKKELDIEAAIKDIEEKIAAIEKSKRDLEIEELTEKNLLEQIAQAEKEISELSPQLKEYSEKLGEKERVSASLKRNTEEKEKDLTTQKEKYASLVEAFEANRASSEDLKAKIFDRERTVSEEKNKLIEVDSLERFAKEELSRDQREGSKLEQELSKIKDALATALSSRKDSETIVLGLEGVIKETAEKRKAAEALYLKSETGLQALKEDLISKGSKLSFLKDAYAEHQGFSEGVREVIKAQKGNIIGVIADLINVEEKYEQAVEAALGQNLQTILTESDSSAKKLIEYLRKESLGRATFLPKTMIKNLERLSPSEFSKHKGFVGVASDFVSVSEEAKKPIEFLLGKTVVFDTLDNAISFFKSQPGIPAARIATLNGELISRTGIISGGSVQRRGAAHLGRERELLTLAAEIEELKAKLSAQGEEAQRIKSELAELDLKISASSNDKNTALLSLAKFRHEEGSKEQSIKEVGEELSLASQGVAARKTEIDDAAKTRERLSGHIKALLAEKVALDEALKKELERTESLAKAREEEHLRLTEARIEASKFSHDLQAAEDELAILTENVARLQSIISSRTELDLGGKLKTSKETIGALQASLPSLYMEREGLEGALKGLREKKLELSASIESIDQRIRSAEEAERSLRDKLSREEISAAKIESEMEGLSKTVTEEYSMTIEEILSSPLEVSNQAKAKEEARSLKDSLKSIGDVNLLAIEEFDRSKERFTFMSTQLEDLDNARETLKSLIVQLDQKARESFIETIRIVSENFSRIFADLFEGGEAKIMLIEGEDVLDSGIEIIARPSGKKWLSLDLLSGGERALTAIAILFSLLKTHPSPFCFLDEVDAALDDANIGRFGKMLKAFSAETQVVVITHSKRTMSQADVLYGVTMEEPGVSKLVSMKLAEVS